MTAQPPIPLTDMLPTDEPEKQEIVQPPAASHFSHPLTEFPLRIIARVFKLLSHIGVIMYLIGVVAELALIVTSRDGHWAHSVRSLGSILSIMQWVQFPLFLMADFAPILRQRQTYGPLLLKYGAGTLGFLLIYLFVYFRYGVAFLMLIPDMTLSDARHYLDEYAGILFQKLVSLNVFIDLFICVLISFFATYNPVRFFHGKKIYIFRSLVVIPIAYNIVSIVLRALNGRSLVIPGYLFALLPLKPPSFLLAFLALVGYMKVEEWQFTRHGRSLEEFNRYVVTPYAVHKFSRYNALTIMVGSIFDLIWIMFIDPQLSEEAQEVTESIEMGGMAFMFMAVPFLLLFDYTKPAPSNPLLTLIVVLATEGAIVFVYIEGVYWGLFYLRHMG